MPGDGSPFHFDRQIFGTTLLRGVDFNRKQRITDEQPLTVFENEFFDPDGGQLLDEEAGWCDESTLNYRFFVTSTGSPALGPIALQEGDTVALLRGGNVPYVLRKCTDYPQRLYHFVGECYVHGAMDGEVCPPNKDWEKVTII